MRRDRTLGRGRLGRRLLQLAAAGDGLAQAPQLPHSSSSFRRVAGQSHSKPGIGRCTARPFIAVDLLPHVVHCPCPPDNRRVVSSASGAGPPRRPARVQARRRPGARPSAPAAPRDNASGRRHACSGARSRRLLASPNAPSCCRPRTWPPPPDRRRRGSDAAAAPAPALRRPWPPSAGCTSMRARNSSSDSDISWARLLGTAELVVAAGGAHGGDDRRDRIELLAIGWIQR